MHVSRSARATAWSRGRVLRETRRRRCRLPTTVRRVDAHIRPCAVPESAFSGWKNKALDDEFSKRHIDLDPAGYFVIYVDRSGEGEIVADHYTNVINKKGVACDPDTGKPIPCTPGYKRPPSKTYRGRTAKELQIAIFEQNEGGQRQRVSRCSMLDHACYLGREFTRAEAALATGEEYIQD